MAFHLLAYRQLSVAATMTNMAGLVDQVITRAQTSNVYLLPAKMRLLAALGLGATIQRVQLTSPTLRQLNIMNFRPLNAALIPLDNVRVSWWADQPLDLPALEEIQPAVLDSGAEVCTFLLWVADQVMPIPSGPILTIRATSTTAATAGAWSILAYTLDNALPAGMYGLVGSNCISTTGVAHRWQIPGQVLRPGTLSAGLVTDRTDQRLDDRRLGNYGNFVNTALPQIEVLCTAADAAHEIYMQIVPLNFTLLRPGQ